jgi:hypothetical protein
MKGMEFIIVKFHEGYELFSSLIMEFHEGL